MDVAKTHGFDGYLLNFECEVKDTKKLLNFVTTVTAKLHEQIPHSLAIWYDSVIEDGSLKWQSELNEKNAMFFKATDGFFVDYHWKQESL